MLRVCVNHYPAGLSQKAHVHADTTVALVLVGTLTERVGGAHECASALSIVVKPRDTEHSDLFVSAVTTLQIVVADADVDELQHWNPKLATWAWRHTGSAVPAFLTLLGHFRTSHDCEGSERVERSAIDVLAKLCDGATATRPTPPPRWLSAVREQLDDTERLPSVLGLAAEAGVHPVYLARQFRRWFGYSMTEYTRRRRARRAAAAVMEPRTSLSRASYTAGFADHAHMCRVFRRETGLTPGAYRKLVTMVPTVQDRKHA